MNGRFSCRITAYCSVDVISVSASVINRSLPVWALLTPSLRSSREAGLGNSAVRCALHELEKSGQSMGNRAGLMDGLGSR
jgi:hypothetical protein